MIDKIAVHCKTEEEFIAVGNKCSPGNLFSWGARASNSCIKIDERVNSGLSCVDEGYTIIPASEYLKRGEEKFKVGDRKFRGLYFPRDVKFPLSESTIEGLGQGHCAGFHCPVEVGCRGCIISQYNQNTLQIFLSSRLYINQPKSTKKEESIMSENVTIGSIFLEVFPNGKEAKKMSDCFGSQYGDNPDRDLIALRRDMDYLLKIVAKEDEEEAAEKK